jgi:trehalose 6-phosphate synthase
MKLTFRGGISLLGGVGIVAALFSFVHRRREGSSMLEELITKASLLASALEDAVAAPLAAHDQKGLARILAKFTDRDHIDGIAIYGVGRQTVAATSSLRFWLPVAPAFVPDAGSQLEAGAKLFRAARGRDVYGYFMPIVASDGDPYLLTVYLSAGHVQTRIRELYQQGFVRLFLQAILIALITVFVIRWNIMSPLYRAADWIKNLRLGLHEDSSAPLPKDLFGPLEKEVTRLAKSLNSARAAAEEEAKLRQQGESTWTPDRLKEFVRSKMPDQKLVVVSNREPYMHERKGKDIQWIMPASGLVTALEPILRACGGTWVAHGSGNADREMTGDDNRLRVPPDEPQYLLRRVWLSKEEEDGYYYGFSNEGFWPLCHIAHTRPVFKPEDWAYYQSVNAKFADAVLEEIADVDEPLVLIQDYHFALLPRLIKEKRPDARVALFWHIPWPNPESFGICPWQREILHGMLGADLLGFHIQFHCTNFLDTVDRSLECRINWEQFTINRQNHKTIVKPFPISVALTPTPRKIEAESQNLPNKETLMKYLGVKGDFLAVGVDRIDYTKGIIERFRGIERFLEKYSEYVGRFVFVELGAPSRTLIKRYHDLMAEVEEEAERINWKFKTKEWQPIVFLKKHHSHKDIEPFYKTADICLVTSLHDGMNLVAKEYIAARTDEDGVLILSRFTGAARELSDALLINPYDVDRTAEAIRAAIEMDPEERRKRMRRMRTIVMDNNIYKWGAHLIEDLAQIRLEMPSKILP